MKVLILTPFLPCRGAHGGAAQMMNLWSATERELPWELHIFSYATSMEEGRHEQALETFENIDIFSAQEPLDWNLSPYVTVAKSGKAGGSFYSESYVGALKKKLVEEDWELVILDMQIMMHYATLVKELSNARVCLFVYEALEDRYKDNLELYDDFITYREAFKRDVDFLLCFSDEEKGVLDPHYNGAPVYTLPLCVDLHGLEIERKMPGQVLFLGCYKHPPNIDAVDYFLEEVMPAIDKDLDYEFHVCGSFLDDDLRERWQKYSRVKVVGYVDDPLKEMAASGVFIAPIISGKGVRTKVVEALSQNATVVATSLAVEGIFVERGVDCLVADDPEAFAEHVSFLLREAGRHSVGENARECVLKHDPNHVVRLLEDIVLSDCSTHA